MIELTVIYLIVRSCIDGPCHALYVQGQASLSIQHGEETGAAERQAYKLYGTFRNIALFPPVYVTSQRGHIKMKDCSITKKKKYSSFVGMGIGHGRARTAALPAGKDKTKRPAKANKRQCKTAEQLDPISLGA
jgi:hypothetical protein